MARYSGEVYGAGIGGRYWGGGGQVFGVGGGRYWGAGIGGFTVYALLGIVISELQ